MSLLFLDDDDDDDDALLPLPLPDALDLLPEPEAASLACSGQM